MEIKELKDNSVIFDDSKKSIFKICVRTTQDISKELSHINYIQIEKSLKVDGHHLFSLAIEKVPESGWSNFICKYPKSIWIIDEYCESVHDNTLGGDLRYKQSIIYRVMDGIKVFKQVYNFDDLDSLLQIYPVHFGNIRIEELKSEIQRLKSKTIKVENNLNTKRGEMSKGSIKQWDTYTYIQRHKISRNVSEIRFITSLWERLNDELYGYDDKDLSMRYRGIDEFSPLVEISTGHRI